MAVPIKKGVQYDCSMFDVRCNQECVSGGLRHTDKCPYDNYKKRSEPMADNKKKGGGNNGGFTPTFRKYADMSQGEKDAFRQGATTANNSVKEKLGLKAPKKK